MPMAPDIDTWFRMAREGTDAIVQKAQSAGLSTAASMARRLLGKTRPQSGWANWERSVTHRLLDVLCSYDEALPDPDAIDAARTTRRFVETLPQRRSDQLRNLLAIIEAGPLLLAPEGERGVFTSLSEVAAETYIRGWSESSIPQRRAVFHALKSVCMMGYWSQEETWSPIGFDPGDHHSHPADETGGRNG
jgi:hypothetical protein